MNARGGVNGRKIEYRVVDDAYNPAETVPQTRQLVEQDKVFAIFNSLGTGSNLAVRPYLNAMKVPQLFVATGATTWGRGLRDVPVHDRLPAELPGRGLGLRQVPRAHRAGRDDRGAVPERRLRQGPARRAQARAARSKAKVIAAQPYDVDGDRRPVADGQAEGVRRRHARDLRDADVRDPGVLDRRTSSAGSRSSSSTTRSSGGGDDAERVRRRAEQARQRHDLDRLPQGPERSAVEGRRRDEAVPADPRRATRRARRRRRSTTSTGWRSPTRSSRRCKRAGKNLTREALVKALDTFTSAGNPFLLPGITVKTAGQRSLPDRADAAPALAGRPGSRSAASGATAPSRLAAAVGAAAGSGRSSMLRPSGARRPPRRQPVTDGTPRLRDPQRVARRPHGRGARRCAAGALVTYSPKVFIPLTTLCRDVCDYCTFARPPRRGERAYHDGRRGARDRARRRGGRLHARRSSRSATSRSCATASRARSSRRSASRRRSSTWRTAPAGARRDRAAAAPQPGRDEPRRARAAASGLGVDGDHARDGLRPAVASAAGRTGPRRTSCRRVRLETIRLAGRAARSRSRAGS